MGEYLEQYLQPLVSKGRLYLWDNKQLISELQNIQDAGEGLLGGWPEECKVGTTEEKVSKARTMSIYTGRPKNGYEQ